MLSLFSDTQHFIDLVGGSAEAEVLSEGAAALYAAQHVNP